MEALLALIGIVVVIFGLLVYESFSWGFVFWKFWGWFVLPVFVTLPAITFFEAVGLVFFVGLFKNHNSQQFKEDVTDKTQTLLMGIILPWVVFSLAWIIKALFIN